uniref:Uncharacterized protein n=1 Tax=Romanomermis culicivorax TaxID=13658 RepID=A0A915JR68_ROMCU
MPDRLMIQAMAKLDEISWCNSDLMKLILGTYLPLNKRSIELNWNHYLVTPNKEQKDAMEHSLSENIWFMWGLPDCTPILINTLNSSPQRPTISGHINMFYKDKCLSSHHSSCWMMYQHALMHGPKYSQLKNLEVLAQEKNEEKLNDAPELLLIMFDTMEPSCTYTEIYTRNFCQQNIDDVPIILQDPVDRSNLFNECNDNRFYECYKMHKETAVDLIEILRNNLEHHTKRSNVVPASLQINIYQFNHPIFQVTKVTLSSV